MKLFTAGLATETNSFVNLPTGYRAFEDGYLVHGGRHAVPAHPFALPLQVFRRHFEARGWQVVESLCAFAMPAGRTTRAAYERLRDRILDDLEGALPVDLVLLLLHGAMIAEGYDDCEGDLLERVRARIGPDVPLGVELDLHANLSARMVANADALVAFKAYPHTDIADRAHDLARLMERAAAYEIRPVMSVFDCRMLGIFHTTREPMAGFVAAMTAEEGRGGVLSASLLHGFPWADVADTGAQLLVVADDDAERGQALAEALGRRFVAMREATRPPYLGLDEALSLAQTAHGGRPVVLADVSDNPGGGAAGDSTPVLRALVECGVEAAALACLWDPVAVQICTDAGEGAELELRIGGKTGRASGSPLDVRARVTRLVDDLRQTFAGGAESFGPAASIRVGGVDVVLASHRRQAKSPDCFRQMGIEPESRRLLVVKSMQHFHASFTDLAAEILYVAAPGALTPDFGALPYTKLRRPIWPLDPHPLAEPRAGSGALELEASITSDRPWPWPA